MTESEKPKVAVIGAGVAGISVALTLRKQGVETDIFEKEEKPGGHLRKWHALFPGREHAATVLNNLMTDGADGGNLNIRLKSNITGIIREGSRFRLTTGTGETRNYEAVVLANGFNLFDASRKEEYGYGIYSRVITSADLESRFSEENRGLLIDGKSPRRVAFVHCVGSRDAKVGNHYCSRICCITGVKQAISVKEMYTGCEVFNFYMDLRMFGSGYEELYQEAQEKYGITFIRGRVSEAAQTIGGAIVMKAEDTLLGRPLKITVDWLVLLIGMEPGNETKLFSDSLGLQLDQAGFQEGKDRFIQPGMSSTKGVFIAGTCSGPASIPETVNQGRATAVSVIQFLSESHHNEN